MRSEMGSLIQRNGGVPYSAPVLQEVYLKDSPDVRRLVQDVCSGAVNVMVLLTGVGTNALIETAAAMGCQEEFLQSLDRLTVIARSPKPARVLRQHKIHIDVMPPEPYTSEDLLNAVGGIDLEGRELAVQAYGSPNGFLTQGLRDQGANVPGGHSVHLGAARGPVPRIQADRRPRARGRRRRGLHQPATAGEPGCNCGSGRIGEVPAAKLERSRRSRWLCRPCLHPRVVPGRNQRGRGARSSPHGEPGASSGQVFRGRPRVNAG